MNRGYSFWKVSSTVPSPPLRCLETISSAIPSRVKSVAPVKLAGGVPFVSDADLEAALDEAGVNRRTSEAALDAYRDARIDGLRTSLAILAVVAILALFYAQRIPTTQPGAQEPGVVSG